MKYVVDQFSTVIIKGEINFTLLSGIGSAVFDQKVSEANIIEALAIVVKA